MKTQTVLYTAAHAGFDLARVPLGGAATICALLQKAWNVKAPFKLQLIQPEILGPAAPQGKDLVRYSEMRYARFCFDFEAAITREILKHDPKEVVVLSNDVSEGPRFRELAERGYRLYTIYHVNVLDYFAAIYLRGWIKPMRLAQLYDALDRSPIRRMIPAVSKLIFEKQRDSLRGSRGVIVPSVGMKQSLLETYPGVEPEKIHVLPWGAEPHAPDESVLDEPVKELRKRYAIPDNARVLITLSRISPEKGQDRLLQAIERWERAGDFPTEGLWVFICGEAAYMEGVRFQKKLQQLAKRIKKAQVIFPGFLADSEKRAHLRLANLYVFPSRHESYGLTLLEAFQAGLPALATHHHGAADLLHTEFGELLPPTAPARVPDQLTDALRRLLRDPERLREMGRRAQTFAAGRNFATTAEQLAALLMN